MEELVKYFEGLEERIATLEAELSSLEAELDELKNRPVAAPQVIEKVEEKIVEKPVEVIKEVVVEKPVAESQEPKAESPEPEPVVVPEQKPVQEEQISPNAALYGKAVDDIRQAISLGDRFLYQRELFGQNAELMQRTLNELNALGSFDEAMNYIAKFSWDQESNTYQQFIVTLHRRFG